MLRGIVCFLKAFIEFAEVVINVGLFSFLKIVKVVAKVIIVVLVKIGLQGRFPTMALQGSVKCW